MFYFTLYGYFALRIMNIPITQGAKCIGTHIGISGEWVLTKKGAERIAERAAVELAGVAPETVPRGTRLSCHTYPIILASGSPFFVPRGTRLSCHAEPVYRATRNPFTLPRLTLDQGDDVVKGSWRG
jgi:hypothetical protein